MLQLVQCASHFRLVRYLILMEGFKNSCRLIVCHPWHSKRPCGIVFPGSRQTCDIMCSFPDVVPKTKGDQKDFDG